jgi:hypothetical protein
MIDEMERSSQAAQAEEERRATPIVTMARELSLNPWPAGHNEKAWMANCPRTNHWLMISTENNEFGCGYCGRKGGPAELRSFYEARNRRESQL